MAGLRSNGSRTIYDDGREKSERPNWEDFEIDLGQKDLGSPRAERGQKSGATYHRFVGVLLELNQTHSGDVFHIDVTVGSFDVVAAVQVWHYGRGRHADGILPVHFVSDHIVSLQQRLRK